MSVSSRQIATQKVVSTTIGDYIRGEMGHLMPTH